MDYQKIAKDLAVGPVLARSLNVFLTVYQVLAVLAEGTISRRQERDLLAAALLHDIGKAMWPQDWHEKPLYLLGPGVATVMRAHPLQGANALRGAGIPEEIACLVKEHHERPGGKGCPLGVEPSFASLVLAACDVFAACMEKRTYRPGGGNCSIEEALKTVAKFAPGAVVKALAGVVSAVQRADRNSSGRGI